MLLLLIAAFIVCLAVAGHLTYRAAAKNGVPCILPIKEGMASVKHLLRSLCSTLLIPHDLTQ